MTAAVLTGILEGMPFITMILRKLHRIGHISHMLKDTKKTEKTLGKESDWVPSVHRQER